MPYTKKSGPFGGLATHSPTSTPLRLHYITILGSTAQDPPVVSVVHECSSPAVTCNRIAAGHYEFGFPAGGGSPSPATGWIHVSPLDHTQMFDGNGYEVWTEHVNYAQGFALLRLTRKGDPLELSGLLTMSVFSLCEHSAN